MIHYIYHLSITCSSIYIYIYIYIYIHKDKDLTKNLMSSCVVPNGISSASFFGCPSHHFEGIEIVMKMSTSASLWTISFLHVLSSIPHRTQWIDGYIGQVTVIIRVGIEDTIPDIIASLFFTEFQGLACRCHGRCFDCFRNQSFFRYYANFLLATFI